MMKRLSVVILALLLLCFAGACDNAPDTPQEGLEASLGTLISTPEEFVHFLEGTQEVATLTGNITLGDEMLRLESGRSAVTVNGDGHMVTGTNACVLRMENGTSVTLNNTTIIGTLGGVGIMGDAAISGTNCSIRSDSNGIEATGKLTVGENSSLTVESKNGSAIVSAGVEIANNASVTAAGQQAGINAGRGDLHLMEHASVDCKGADYNALKTDGDLILDAMSTLSVMNTDTHNGAKVGALVADETATIQASGGEYGIGLFIVEQNEDVTLKGFCKPDVRYEMGSGRIHFNN